MTWVLLAVALFAGWFMWKWLGGRRGSADVGASIANLLTLQAMLFRKEGGEPLGGRAADRFSVGYVFGFAVAMLTSSGKLHLNDLPPIINVIFELSLSYSTRFCSRKQIVKKVCTDVLQPPRHLPLSAALQIALRILPTGRSTASRLWVPLFHRGLMLDDLTATFWPK